MTQEVKQAPEVVRVIGAPGTGKTTTMVGNPELEMDGLFVQNAQKYSFDEQMLVTYTNAGVDEAASRLSTLLADKTKDRIEDRVMTIHGMCFRRLDLNYKRDVVQWGDEKDFCEGVGLKYGHDDDDGDIMTSEGEAGNKLLQIYRWLQSNRLEIEDAEQCPVDWDVPRDLKDLLRKWTVYKHSNGLVGFGDMIEKVVDKNVAFLREGDVGDTSIEDDREYLKSCRHDDKLTPKLIENALRGQHGFVDTKVLYVDECQDLDKLQWDWYLCQKLVCEKVYLGGDDDQTIYEWSGADPEQLLGEEGEKQVLETTYRLPAEVWGACEKVITQVENRVQKDVKPTDKEGEVLTYQRPSPRQVMSHIEQSDDVLILFRTRYHIDEFRNDLHDHGIPYKNMSTFNTWTRDVQKARDLVAKLDDGQPVGQDSAEKLVEWASDDLLSYNHEAMAKDEISGMMMPDDLSEVFQMYGGWRSSRYVKGLNDDDFNWFKRQAILGNISRGDPNREPSSVRIGTIHSAKGMEADTVIVGTDTTDTITGNMPNYPESIGDGERRVMYVAMSRAESKLVLCENLVDDGDWQNPGTPSLSVRKLLGE